MAEPRSPENTRCSERSSNSRASSSNSITSTEDSFLEVSIPTFSTGLTTFGYQLALRNRIHESKLTANGAYDVKTYKPTFVHDCLMLPGSLASVLRKLSATEIIPRMTPALLPGFRIDVHPTTQQPCLVQSDDSSDYAQGMLVFGQGRRGRDLIHQHYRGYSRRVKADVEIDVAVSNNPDYPGDSSLDRRKVSAHIWLWSDVTCVERASTSRAQKWSLEHYLDGHYTAEMSSERRVEWVGPDAAGSDDESCVSAHGHHYQYIAEGQTPTSSPCFSTGYISYENGRRSAISHELDDNIW